MFGLTPSLDVKGLRPSAMTSPGLIQSVDEQIGQPSEPGETEIPAFSPRDRPAYRRKLRVPGLNTGGEGGIRTPDRAFDPITV
jgi:hypothetical protein